MTKPINIKENVNLPIKTVVLIIETIIVNPNTEKGK